MKVVGIDVGNLTTKLVMLDDGQVLYYDVAVGLEEAGIEAEQAFDKALRKTKLLRQDIEYIIATGIGKDEVTLAQERRSVFSCIANGAKRFFPSCRTVIDLGADTCSVAKIEETGLVGQFASQDKCASGAGIFLETMSKALHVPLKEFGRRSLLAERKVEITSTCAIFAEQEVISLFCEEPAPSVNEMIAGIHNSLATRVAGLVRQVGIQPDVMVCGGVAKDFGFARSLEQTLGLKLLVPEEPQIIAALGAATIAQQRVLAQRRSS